MPHFSLVLREVGMLLVFFERWNILGCPTFRGFRKVGRFYVRFFSGAGAPLCSSVSSVAKRIFFQCVWRSEPHVEERRFRAVLRDQKKIIFRSAGGRYRRAMPAGSFPIRPIGGRGAVWYVTSITDTRANEHNNRLKREAL